MLYSERVNQTQVKLGRCKHTVVYWPPERIWVIDLAIEGFSATQSTLMDF